MSSPGPANETDITDTPEDAEDAPIMRFGPILEAIQKHGPIFRREQFNAAYAAYHIIDDDEPEPEAYKNHSGRESIVLQTGATLPDLYGVEQETTLFKAGLTTIIDGKTHVGKRLWNYCDLQDLAYRLSFGHPPLLPFQFFASDLPVDTTCGPIEPDDHRKASDWRAEWEASDFSRKLTSFFAGHSKNATQRIDQIVCFGLGMPVSQSQPRALRRSYVQHLAACTIRDLLAEYQSGKKPKVYAQEPGYKSKDIAYLADQFDMTVLEDPEGFRVLDGNTFVITVAPNVPVRQVAFDMTHECGGPAGFLCNDIYSDGLESEGKKEDDVDLYTCNPSPALWRYKQEGVWMEYDDRDEGDCFGSMGVYLKRADGKHVKV
jgi:hypothetical protein